MSTQRYTSCTNCGPISVDVEDGQVVGIVTGRDLRFETRLDAPVREIMTPRERLVTVKEGASLAEAKALPNLDAIFDALCARLRAGGVAVDRAIVSTKTLHAVHLSYFRLWRADGESLSDTYDRDEVHLGYFDRSPFRVTMETGEAVELIIAETPDEAFGIVPDLRRDGFSHYFCAPLRFSDGDINQVSWATKQAGGFSPAELAPK